ncbi:IclR family transcriptional regulator [Thioclava dalianensis]|uniref:IclR family transcriptional regulator n=1 Tax=Thioclava dalianensis TaxID=1185766 RepID=A0A074TFS6_9RHOB|nr:IclR family transcriptional regulator [Thioclava dalianensis]KEP70581.1 IclR family transcriptional regulator [Thioclava dalianensis]SFN07229.1 transcriptional regulator, IclR family [Thioclava dalianensis]
MNEQTPAPTKADGTVGRTLAVLDLVAEFARPVRFGELLPRSGLPKATLYRFLQTLTNQGMLAYDEDRQCYSPGLRLVRLAHAAWTQSALAPVAAPFLDALSQETGETLHLAQLDQGMVLYVDKRNAARPVEMFSQSGKVGPAYCTGVGKAMLAHLPEPLLKAALARQSFHRFTDATLADEASLRAELSAIRTRGYAWDNEEHEPGIRCIAAPILSPQGRILGALSITTGHSESREMLQGYAPLMLKTAAKIAKAATDWRFPEQKKEDTP